MYQIFQNFIPRYDSKVNQNFLSWKGQKQVSIASPNNFLTTQIGAICNFAAPLNAAVTKPVGQWNTFEIEVTAQKYIVMLNGEIVIPEFTGNRNTEGYIGIQNHDTDSRVSFKNIRIREKRQQI